MHNDTYTVNIDREEASWELIHDSSEETVTSGDLPLNSETVLDEYESDMQSRHSLSETEGFMHRDNARSNVVSLSDKRSIKRNIEQSEEDLTVDGQIPDDTIIEYIEV